MSIPHDKQDPSTLTARLNAERLANLQARLDGQQQLAAQSSPPAPRPTPGHLDAGMVVRLT